MAKDFANGARRKQELRRDGRGRGSRRESAFHLGSFGAGVALGVAFTLAGALLPQWWSSSATETAPIEAKSADPEPATRFEFFDRLPNARLTPRTAPNARAPSPRQAAAEQREYLLQAGSFTNAEDAQRLSASLLASGLASETATVTLSSGAVRHRVIVGPFASSAATQRALTQLRDKDIEALVLARKPGAG
jgi:cell division protein FtsN